MVSIYPKISSEEGIDHVEQLLENHLLRYHMSLPIKDFNNEDE